MFAPESACAQAATTSQPAAARPQEVKQHVTSRRTWLRFVNMGLFVVAFGLLHCVLALVVVVQSLMVLATGRPNERLLVFGHDLGNYYYHIVLYLTFRTESRPFPFSEWRPEPGQRA